MSERFTAEDYEKWARWWDEEAAGAKLPYAMKTRAAMLRQAAETEREREFRLKTSNEQTASLLELARRCNALQAEVERLTKVAEQRLVDGQKAADERDEARQIALCEDCADGMMSSRPKHCAKHAAIVATWPKAEPSR